MWSLIIVSSNLHTIDAKLTGCFPVVRPYLELSVYSLHKHRISFRFSHFSCS